MLLASGTSLLGFRNGAMRKYLSAVAALLLTGCASMDRDDKVGVAVVSVIAGAALLVSASEDDDDPTPAKCRTIIRPNGGDAWGPTATIC
jgi:hypothetical protein